jgi:MFS family permease
VLFYLLGGWLGERWGRRQVLIGTALLVPPLNLMFLLAHEHAVLVVVYFLIYQVTNGTWSGAGYAYQAESFPTRVRGTAVGFLGAMFAAGILLGAALWTLLMTVSTPTVTWLVIAVGAAFGQWLTICERSPPTMLGRKLLKNLPIRYRPNSLSCEIATPGSRTNSPHLRLLIASRPSAIATSAAM